MVGRCCCLRLASLTFITRVGFSTGTLACTLDSLVRVSRRVGKDHFDRIAQGTLRPRIHRHLQAAYRSKPGLAGLCGHATPSGLTTPRKLCSLQPLFPAPRRRIHLYRFLLNGFRSFDSLSKVLFIFPSQYLFAIGFPHIFSLRRSLSPT